MKGVPGAWAQQLLQCLESRGQFASGHLPQTTCPPCCWPGNPASLSPRKLSLPLGFPSVHGQLDAQNFKAQDSGPPSHSSQPWWVPVALGRRARASLLAEAQAHGATQAAAAAHVPQHPGPQVREAAVLRQHDAGPRVALGHVQSCDGHCTAHLQGVQRSAAAQAEEGGLSVLPRHSRLACVFSQVGFELFSKPLPFGGLRHYAGPVFDPWLQKCLPQEKVLGCSSQCP